MKLSAESLKNTAFWEKAGITLPRFNREEMISASKTAPKWVHFGAGNIFRAFPAALMQQLLNEGIETTGIIVAEGYDGEIIDKSFKASDNLSILVTLKSDGSTDKQVIASFASSLRMDKELAVLKEIFKKPSLQMASFTITEKGYSLTGRDGALFPDLADDLKTGTSAPKSYLGRIACLLHERYINGALPIAMVSMDNCSHNGDILFSAMEAIAKAWTENKKADAGFLNYIRDKSKVSFPWSMIDKITPRPDESVREMLLSAGLEEMQGVITEKNTYIAPFVNAEETQYLVIEDAFPNGRPALEKAGVLFTNKETVDRVEKMKVCTCLNPLHTSLAVFGCMLGYTRISEEMKDDDLVKLIKGIGYTEGLPVVTDPLIIKPRDFIDQVINVRLPNPFMPDAPQRIAMDTSLKIPIRFGETLKAYKEKGSSKDLKFIPLVFAGWLRYLVGINDKGEIFEVSPDPNYETLSAALSGITLGQTGPFTAKLKPILSNPVYFGVNLYEIGLGERIEDLFKQMVAGTGAVRKVLNEVVRG
ncbi:MAG: mannitol dehydrogenase family protein [Treponema sp.]|nr:mannitol dehydrogenase family protein [Treponema sp.]MCL2250413.1 mannitol dehydrogenase family protein [Treponema sp.]